jgi:hypothetical protein
MKNLKLFITMIIALISINLQAYPYIVNLGKLPSGKCAFRVYDVLKDGTQTTLGDFEATCRVQVINPNSEFNLLQDKEIYGKVKEIYASKKIKLDASKAILTDKEPKKLNK